MSLRDFTSPNAADGKLTRELLEESFRLAAGNPPCELCRREEPCYCHAVLRDGPCHCSCGRCQTP